MFSAFSCLLLVNSLKRYFVGIHLLLTLYKTCQIHVVNQIEMVTRKYIIRFALFLTGKFTNVEERRGIEQRGYKEHNLYSLSKSIL